MQPDKLAYDPDKLAHDPDKLAYDPNKLAYDPDRKQQAGRQAVTESVMWRGSRRDQLHCSDWR